MAECYEGPLPRGFEEDEPRSISMKDGCDILYKTCSYCIKNSDCTMKKAVSSAMGDNYPYWSAKHFFLKAEWNSFYHFPFCEEFESPQLELDGIEREFPQGIEHAVRMIREEEAERDRNWESSFDREPARPVRISFTLMDD